MKDRCYVYRFHPETPMQEVEETLLLAVLAAEALHGRSGVNLDAEFSLDRKQRRCLIERGSDVGHSIAKIFTRLLTAEIGEDAFTVERAPFEDPAPCPA